MSANAALAPEDGRIKNVSGAALFVKYGPARKRENSERGHARRRSVRAFEHSGQSRFSCLQKDRTGDSHFHTGLGDRVHNCLAAALVVMRLEELGSFSRALSRSPLACGFSDVPLSAESSLAKSAEQSAKAAPAKPTLATAAKAMVLDI